MRNDYKVFVNYSILFMLRKVQMALRVMNYLNKPVKLFVIYSEKNVIKGKLKSHRHH